MSEEVKETQDNGLVIAKNGKPFASKNAARLSMGQQKITGDVVPFENGFAIKPEKYYRVIFNAKGSPSDQDDVQLSVNGEQLLIRREEPVIIPGRFKECADNTRYPMTRQEPGKLRKTITWVQTFPYAPIGEATEEEFLAQKAEGTKKVRNDVHREEVIE